MPSKATRTPKHPAGIRLGVYPRHDRLKSRTTGSIQLILGERVQAAINKHLGGVFDLKVEGRILKFVPGQTFRNGNVKNVNERLAPTVMALGACSLTDLIPEDGNPLAFRVPEGLKAPRQIDRSVRSSDGTTRHLGGPRPPAFLSKAVDRMRQISEEKYEGKPLPMSTEGFRAAVDGFATQGSVPSWPNNPNFPGWEPKWLMLDEMKTPTSETPKGATEVSLLLEFPDGTVVDLTVPMSEAIELIKRHGHG